LEKRPGPKKLGPAHHYSQEMRIIIEKLNKIPNLDLRFSDSFIDNKQNSCTKTGKNRFIKIRPCQIKKRKKNESLPPCRKRTPLFLFARKKN
jgi:hypothetical protein